MRWNVLLATLMTSAGCASLPDTPPVSLCVIDYDARLLYCQNVVDSKQRDVFLHNADNYVAVSPDDWAAINIYIDDLKDLAQVRCK